MNLSQKMPEKLVKWYECRIACSTNNKETGGGSTPAERAPGAPCFFLHLSGEGSAQNRSFSVSGVAKQRKVSVDHSWYGSAFLIQGLKQRNSDEFHGPACERGPSQYNDSRQTVLLRAR
jgi:hypothetical protein